MYIKRIWVNDETELNAENMNHIENGIEGSYNITLLAVSDVEPTECEVGDKYYNTEDKVIYTATATDTWGSIGETPTSGILYVVFDEKNTYSWDGTDLVSVGGGSGSEIVIEPDEPTEDTKLIIEESDLDFQGLDYVEDVYSTDEVKTNKRWINGKPVYRRVFNLTSPSTTGQWTDYSHNIANIDEFINCKAYLKLSSGEQFFADFAESSTYYFNFVPKVNMFSTRIGFAGYANKTMRVIVEYTKTTD